MMIDMNLNWGIIDASFIITCSYLLNNFASLFLFRFTVFTFDMTIFCMLEKNSRKLMKKNISL